MNRKENSIKRRKYNSFFPLVFLLFLLNKIRSCFVKRNTGKKKHHSCYELSLNLQYCIYALSCISQFNFTVWPNTASICDCWFHLFEPGYKAFLSFSLRHSTEDGHWYLSHKWRSISSQRFLHWNEVWGSLQARQVLFAQGCCQMKNRKGPSPECCYKADVWTLVSIKFRYYTITGCRHALSDHKVLPYLVSVLKNNICVPIS